MCTCVIGTMPRKKLKTGRRKGKAKSATTAAPKAAPTCKRKQWREESMTAALVEARKGIHAINKIAVMYGVPKSTLYDRISGRVQHGKKPGPSPYLDPKEEQELAGHLISIAKIGYGKTRKEVKLIAENVAKEKKVLRASRISDGWWKSFCRRNQSLSLRRADSTAHVRMDSVNKGSIDQYFNLLEETMLANNILRSPNQIYNMDETGMPLSPRTSNIVAKLGQKKVRYRTSGKKEQIAIIACANAAGQTIPPMVIFEGKYLNHEWTIGEVPGTIYGMSDKGWTDQQLFMFWLKHFLNNAVPARPLLLLLDGHSSHFELSSIQLAEQEGVIILCLPPHTTHESQPLDCGVFGPLKKQWTQVCHDFQQANKGAVISKYVFSRLFSQAWLKALSSHNIIAGFGVYPFNRNAIEILNDDTANESGIDLNCNHDDCTSMLEDFDPSDVNQYQLSDEINEQSAPTHSFTEQDILLFQRRFEEGYDLYDPLYQKWLELEHPETSTSHHSGSLLLNLFPEAPVINPVEMIDDGKNAENSTESQREAESSVPNFTTNTKSNHSVQQTVSNLPEVILNTPCSNSLSVTNKENISSNGELTTTVLSKYLRTPTITKPKSSTRAITTARVLTSTECLDIIREKETKKKAEEETKQQRKREREEKKRKAEEEKQKKAEERKRKLAEKAESARKAAEEKAEKAKKIAQEKARKMAEKEHRLAEKARLAEEQREAQKVDKNSTATTMNDFVDEEAPIQRSSRKRHRDSRSSAAKKKYLGETEASRDENQCCVCFEMHDPLQGDWVQCSCMRWLHEDCVLDAIKDADGNIRLCPYCID